MVEKMVSVLQVEWWSSFFAKLEWGQDALRQRIANELWQEYVDE